MGIVEQEEWRVGVGDGRGRRGVERASALAGEHDGCLEVLVHGDRGNQIAADS